MDRFVTIEEFRAGNLLPPLGNEEGGYWAYDEAQAVWEAIKQEAASEGGPC